MGPELYIVIGVIVLLFGGSQLPKLARSLGEAKGEFEKSQKPGDKTTVVETQAKVVETPPTVVEVQPTIVEHKPTDPKA